MALFDRDYDRDYGRRYGYGARGRYDQGLGGTGRYLWNEAQDESREGWNAARRAVTPNSPRYDRGFGGRARHLWNEAKDETREGWNAVRRGTGRLTGRYDRPTSRGWEGDVDTGAYYGGAGYGYGTPYARDYGATRWGAGERYDRGYKSRAETDYGDPFGDRASHTPMRMVDEDRARRWGAYDRDYGSRGWGASARYDRGFRDVSDEGRYRGVGYDPYAGGGYRYDRDWF